MEPRLSIRRVPEVHIPPKRFKYVAMPQHLRKIVGFFGGDRARIVPNIARTTQAWRDGDRQKTSKPCHIAGRRQTFAAKTALSRDQGPTH
jgi:hypothetical protein